MPIFWINTWEHVSKRCILPLLGLLLNWALTALKWEPNESKCPHFWASRYIYLSRPNQPPPVDVSGTTAAMVQGCSGKWNPATAALMGKQHALSTARWPYYRCWQHNLRKGQLTRVWNAEWKQSSLPSTGALHYVSILGIENEQIRDNVTL